MRSLGGLAVLVVVVVLAGCGGSSSSSSSSTVGAALCDPTPCQLTRALLAAKVDALCLRGNAAVNQADASFEQATKVSDYTKAAAAMESALREFPPYQFAILGLTPPAQDRVAFTRYVDLTRRIHGLSGRIVAAGRARATPEVARLSQLVLQAVATRTRAAVDLGTKHCGR